VQGFGLLGDDIEKAKILFDVEEGFGLLESHAGAKPTVEADLDGVRECLLSAFLGGSREFFGVGLWGRGLDLRFGE